jgi:hypothetical protein
MYALIAFEIKNLLGYVHKTTAKTKLCVVHHKKVVSSKYRRFYGILSLWRGNET